MVEQKVVAPASHRSPARMVSLSIVKTNIPLGKAFAVFEYGWFCKYASTTQYRGTELNITGAEYLQSFSGVLKAAQYPQPIVPVGAFDEPKMEDVDLLAGATIEDVDLNVCVPFSGDPNLRLGFLGTLKGSVYMKVRWQLFSLVAKKVVYEAVTEGSYKSEGAISSSTTEFLRKAFESSLQNLLTEPGFMDVMHEPKEGGKSGRDPN
ncbi:hypothetical protein GT347_21885 [Xylophilus rhododendri]|uniref:Uncharacterized protein n=1 Tax=Xylophilus rhododendri TaxID=2697032 RepID=A0A857J8U7_9BURK|nr:hypothetical protein [Xylophilus rhododendri]QHJ00395.1 hypothetical protein GT347_21885 [Xylophilus rhododendri]